MPRSARNAVIAWCTLDARAPGRMVPSPTSRIASRRCECRVSSSGPRPPRATVMPVSEKYPSRQTAEVEAEHLAVGEAIVGVRRDADAAGRRGAVVDICPLRGRETRGSAARGRPPRLRPVRRGSRDPAALVDLGGARQPGDLRFGLDRSDETEEARAIPEPGLRQGRAELLQPARRSPRVDPDRPVRQAPTVQRGHERRNGVGSRGTLCIVHALEPRLERRPGKRLVVAERPPDVDVVDPARERVRGEPRRHDEARRPVPVAGS